MKIDSLVRTITEVDSNTGSFVITCVATKAVDGQIRPEINKVRVLETPMEIDNTKGTEGELLISHSNKNPGLINADGDLVINTEKETQENYWREDENMMNYEE